MKALIFTYSLVLIALLPGEGFSALRKTIYDENATLVKEMQDTVDTLKHEVSNHETEMKMFDERLNNEESRLDSLRQQFNETVQAQKELLKGSSSTLDERIGAVESTQKSLAADMRQLKNHANDTSNLLGQYQKKLSELEKLIEAQNGNLAHLQSALKSMIDVMQGKSVAVADVATGSRTYTVKSGDSLEKIAKANRTTIQAIKQVNSLAKDKIVVGQVLTMPEQ